jgi:hypothetical protein
LPPETPTAEENGDRYEPLNIADELRDSYLAYAMSVIISRALPDVRDGLKPSQRRILVAMHDLNLGPNSSTSKCAGIIGETMKRYHPHGDASIYMTLVHMAQEWAMRHRLIHSQGNFGSIAGLPPAAMRYAPRATRGADGRRNLASVGRCPAAPNSKWTSTVRFSITAAASSTPANFFTAARTRPCASARRKDSSSSAPPTIRCCVWKAWREFPSSCGGRWEK